MAPAAIPASGFPLTCGIPVPPGVLRDVTAVRLQDAAGRDLPLQTARTGVWPDGSARWIRLTTLLPGGTRPGDRFRLHLNAGSAPRPRAPLTLRRGGQRLTLDTGALRLVMGGDPHCLLDRVHLAGRQDAVLSGLTVRMAIQEEGTEVPVRARTERLLVSERGRVAATIEASGPLEGGGRRLGRFVFRVTAFAGLPTLQTQFRVFNEVKPEPFQGTAADPPLEVTDLALVGTLAKDPVAWVPAEGRVRAFAGGNARLFQDDAGHYRLTGAGEPPVEGEHAANWLAAVGGEGGVHASVWRFWQQYPKALAVADGRLEVALFAPTEEVPAYRPRFGEAKRHDLWLSFWPAEANPPAEAPQALGLLADEPPRLFDRDWFCRSGGVNVLDPRWFENQPRLKEWVQTRYGDVSTARLTGRFGIRDFGDMPYTNGQWRNGYWAMVQGALNFGLVSGDPRWIERSFEIARHIADVDTVHLPPDHPDAAEWGGLTCALGIDHSVHGGNAKWPAFQIGESLLLHYWMTGDPDSRAAGLANAEYILRTRAGWGSPEARQQARAMLTLLRAWQVTGDRRFREGAKRYLDLEYQAKHVVDWRRGAYIQPTYENWRCISAGLNSMYAANIYEYYRLTGDVDAAQMVVAIADSVYAESMLPQEEGLGSFLFYVRYSRGAWYYTQMALLFHLAYDLTEDRRFLRAGRAAFARYLLCTGGDGKPMYQTWDNFGWLDPEYGGWVLRFKDVPTEPFQITREIPDPDPANYQ